jgi:cobalt/nickel transport system permease protein
MHIPDGFLGPKTWIGLTVISGLFLIAAIKRFKRDELEQRVPLIGVTAAFVFAAQMLNVPIAGGTSGHFMGGVLACMLLGPWTGFIIMSLVLVIQALIFQDGGLTTLGANIFNMGLIGSVGGFYVYFIFRLLLWGDRTRPVAYALAAWCSIMLSALFAALELSVSGTVKLALGLPAMLSVHAVIGVFEAIITTTALLAIWRTRPELMMLRKY